jgi:hypothetical protein
LRIGYEVSDTAQARLYARHMRAQAAHRAWPSPARRGDADAHVPLLPDANNNINGGHGGSIAEAKLPERTHFKSNDNDSNAHHGDPTSFANGHGISAATIASMSPSPSHVHNGHLLDTTAATAGHINGSAGNSNGNGVGHNGGTVMTHRQSTIAITAHGNMPSVALAKVQRDLRNIDIGLAMILLEDLPFLGFNMYTHHMHAYLG